MTIRCSCSWAVARASHTSSLRRLLPLRLRLGRGRKCREGLLALVQCGNPPIAAPARGHETLRKRLKNPQRRRRGVTHPGSVVREQGGAKHYGHAAITELRQMQQVRGITGLMMNLMPSPRHLPEVNAAGDVANCHIREVFALNKANVPATKDGNPHVQNGGPAVLMLRLLP